MSGYLGFEPSELADGFTFVSYNNEDAERVGMLVRRLHEEGMPIWYDKGLTYDEKWEEEIALMIRRSGSMLLFLTEGVLQKPKSFVRKEYQRAKKLKKKIYVAILDRIRDEDVPDHASFWWDDVQEHQCIDLTLTASPHEQTGLLLDALGVLKSVPKAGQKTQPTRAAVEEPAPAPAAPVRETPRPTQTAASSNRSRNDSVEQVTDALIKALRKDPEPAPSPKPTTRTVQPDLPGSKGLGLSLQYFP